MVLFKLYPPSNEGRQKGSKKFNKNNGKPTPKAPVLSLEDNKPRGYDKYKNLPKLPLMKAIALGVWYTDAAELEEKVLGEGKLNMKDLKKWKGFVEEMRELGERLMAQYVLDYKSSRGQTGDIKMVIATERSGTAADKVSAFSVLVGDNPIANLRSLDALLGMVTSKVGKRHALTGFEALKELFISSLLPNRKLKSLIQQPLNHLPETKDGNSVLLFWYWEDCLKQRYERFVVALEEASRDMLPVLKDKSLKIMYMLLKNKPEQERRLLTALVNKLGDPQTRCASNADYHLTNLLSEHPNMKAVVIDEVDSFLFRPHLGLRTKYHAVNFLSQIRLSHKGDGPKVAKRLIEVYLALFKVLISEAGAGAEKDNNSKVEDKQAYNSTKDVKEENPSASHVEMDSRLLSALLTGVNRAFPYVSSNEADDIIEVQTAMLFKLVHSKNFNVGVQALMLLDKISSKNQIVSNRVYRALYSKLLLPAAMNTSKAELFIGLLLRAMKSDVHLKRVCAFAKRLLQVALQQPPQYACGCLFLLSEVLKERPPLWNMVLQNESDDDELEHFEDIIEETDKEQGSKEKKREDDVNNVDHGDDSYEDEDEDEDKDEALASYFEDGEGSDEAEDLLVDNSTKHNQEFKISTNSDMSGPTKSSAEKFTPGGYDPRHREPSFSNADHVSWWELAVLASHVHPSVSTMARTLLSGANIVYNGNPLNDLSLPAFLDKFKEKKPKPTSWYGGSQIEPAKKLDMNQHIIGPEILSLAETDVPPEDLVFHKFYVNKMNSSKKPKKKKKNTEDEVAEELFDVDGEGSDDEVDGGDESDNEEIENMLDVDASLEADGEYDYDDLDKIADDEEDLIASDGDAEIPFDADDGEDFDTNADDDDDDVEIDVGEADDGTDIEDAPIQRKHKRKSGASPFASLEDYEHLLNDESPAEKNSKKMRHKSHSNSDGSGKNDSTRKKQKSGRKKRSSK